MQCENKKLLGYITAILRPGFVLLVQIIKMERVIGLGGPFIKANDPKALAAWYEKHLGIKFHGTYATFDFTNSDGSKKQGSNVLTFFKNESDYFAPSQKQVMINLIVRDLNALMIVLKEEGIALIGDPMDEEYGKFCWIMDPEGNKIELWEPPVE
jgi:predicted enzyme related to lactoylglutathione lyase